MALWKKTKQHVTCYCKNIVFFFSQSGKEKVEQISLDNVDPWPRTSDALTHPLNRNVHLNFTISLTVCQIDKSCCTFANLPSQRNADTNEMSVKGKETGGLNSTPFRWEVWKINYSLDVVGFFLAHTNTHQQVLFLPIHCHLAISFAL